ncbi:ATP-binding cassette domain-containing protein [Nocardioides sp. NPDC006303]|uniref:branched-chain amino acid ABC transporter ATP-binding protein/permease n=1 Tax=Nocardioides sp. NPDC006303 TaxID=3156747 RepID=UPI0033A0BA77
MPHVESAPTRSALGDSPLVPAALAVLALVAAVVGSRVLSPYMVFLGISVVTAAIALVGIGVVSGRAGMISLCQLSFAAVGAAVVAQLNEWQAPGGFIVWVILGGAAAGLVGVVIGIPALRLRGVNLAVVTLGFAAALRLTLGLTQFPGINEGLYIDRPMAAVSDEDYFVLAAAFLIASGLLVAYLDRTRLGSSWRAVAYSERGAAAAGVSVPYAKTTAFGISALLAGISGGVTAGQVGVLYPSSFEPTSSLALYVLAVLVGAQAVSAAVVGGVLWVGIPELFKSWGIPQDWALVVFGLAGIQAVASGNSIGDNIQKMLGRRHLPGSAASGPEPSEEGSPDDGGLGSSSPPPDRADAGAVALRARGITLSFGAVTALDDVDIDIPQGAIIGLIGPNGAGKSSLVDVLTGFTVPASGSIDLDDRDLTRMRPTGRARAGLRRTFQQDRVPPGITVGAFVRLVARGRHSRSEINAVLSHFGCPPAHARLADVDLGTRRLVEVAAHVLSRPRVLLLDEPAAGLSHEEHLRFGQHLQAVPAKFGTSVLLIEHDLDLVRSVCTSLVVLNFGRVIAAGPHEVVLRDPAVMKAYMGEVTV